MGRLNEFFNGSKPANPRKLRPIQRLGGGRLLPVGADQGSLLVDFSSNDYLALSEHPNLIAESRRCLEKYGAGSGAARLMSGDLDIFHELEDKVASLKEQEAALVFNSGYAANTGVIPALMGRGDVIFADRLCHASIYDGCRLSMAKLVRFRHNDINHLETCLKKQRGKGKALIIVESIYSMDGDGCPLKDLVAIKGKFDCFLMVDEAHAIGLYGENGGGVIQQENMASMVDIAMGTFGKALGSYGAFVAGSRDLKNYLVNRARSFIYSTALPPSVLGANLAGLDIIQDKPELRRKLHAKAILFKESLQGHGITGDLGNSQIVPITIGDSQEALKIADELGQHGIFATAVRPPTVPEGTARLRFSITNHHTEDVLRSAAHVVAHSVDLPS